MTITFENFCKNDTVEQFESSVNDIGKGLSSNDFIIQDVSLGYCCVNETLANLRPVKNKITTNRSCIKKTFEEKGLNYISELFMANIKDLLKIIYWNKLHHIYVFRVSADLCPWIGKFEFEDLPKYTEIARLSKLVGRLSIICKQRLTMHFSHFISLASYNETTVTNSIREVNQTSKLFNLFGFTPNLDNKLCLHISGVFGDKNKTLERFCENFQKLESHAKSRIAIEHDDQLNKYTFDDLLPIAKKLNCGLVLDCLHLVCNPGLMNGHDCVKEVIDIWSKHNSRPICHLSEQRVGHRLGAHSDYIEALPIFYLLNKDKIDILIESKCKENAVFQLRNKLSATPIVELTNTTNHDTNDSTNSSTINSTNSEVNTKASGSVNGEANGSVNGQANGSVNGNASDDANGEANVE